jgi:transcriptional regulator of met regulon
MTTKARITDLASRLNVTTVTEKPTEAPVSTELVANKPHGEKSDYIKITVTLPPEVYKLISDEVARRKMNKLPNPQLSAVIREAVIAALEAK